ncbi:MAG TPA: ABC transporter substrate-binding protein, partial [Thermoplasmata archaeon]
MVNLNPFDPGTNSVWKAYQTQYNFESLFTYDPNYQIYADLADPAAACPAGTTVAVPGSCVDASKLNITVNLRSGVTFTNGQALTADDVVFTYQTLPWSTLATDIVQAIWWDTPKAPLWNSTTNGGACSAAKCVSHLGIFKTGNLQVRFQLTPHTVPGVTNGGYALVFYDTLVGAIIPSGIWKNHLQSNPQINYSDPALGNIKDSWDQSIDFSFGGPGQYDATVGTGPFYMVSWTRNAGSKSLVYGNYWGKSVAHTWAGTSYPFSPPTDGKHVTEFDFIVFGSLDVVSLALQQGTIDTLLWSLTPGFVNVVSSNPSITIQTVTDSGYFYLSFNTRVAPWNDLCLRQAISMAIDKNYIVNTLMGGYGIPGYAPISIANPTYVNSSATPPTYNQAGIDTKLSGCGYTIDPATGFYRTPSGQPISATILTPPKDYDPVRADAGIMISNNLKAAHLNIDAAPTSFDTIVAKAFTRPVNFQIYVLGWSLGLFPETYLCTFFCSSFDVNKNPAGQNSAGYSNPVVDALINQALYTTDTTARTAIVKHIEGIVAADIPWNVLYYRKNVVAWRNDAWGGWILYPNGNAQFNFYSVVHIQPASTPGTGGGFIGPLTVATSMPDQVFYRQMVPIGVYVSQNGAPVVGATVDLTVQFGTFFANFTGTTGANGKYSTTWTVPLIQGSGTATAKVTYKGLIATNTKVIESTIGPPMPSAQLALSTTTPVILSGGTATIKATVKDATGAGMANLPISIETNLTAGGISPVTATTDGTGAATFTYTAPPATAFVNSQFTDIIRAHINVTSTLARETQSAQIVIVTQNNAAPIWDIVSLSTPVGTQFHVATGTTSALVLVVTNFAGAPVAGVDVDPVFGDAWNFTVAPTTAGSNKTNANGQALFTVTGAGLLGNTTTMALTFQVRGVLFSTSDTILMNLATAASTGYGGYMSLGSRAMLYSPTQSTNSVSVHLFDKLGVGVAGVPAMFKIDYGDFGMPAQFAMAIDYSCPVTCPTYTQANGSLDLNAFGLASVGGSFQSSVGQGWNYGVENFINDFEVVEWDVNFATGVNYDACKPGGSVRDGTDPAPNPRWDGSYIINVTSTTDATGAYTLPFSINQEKKDSRIQVEAFIGASGGTANINANACSFVASVVNVPYHISTGLVTQRAPIFALSSFSTTTTTGVAKPIVTSQANTVRLNAQFKDANGAVSKPVVMLTQGAGSAARNVQGRFQGEVPLGGTTGFDRFGNPIILTLKGASTGYLNYTRIVCNSPSRGSCTAAAPLITLSQGLTFSYIPADPRYAYSARDQLFFLAFGDYWFAPTFESLLAKLPFIVTVAYLYLPTSTAFVQVSLGADLLSPGGTTTATVTAYSSLTGAPVAGASVWVGNQLGVTNATGVATFTVVAGGVGAQETLVTATAPYGGVARGWYALVASNPVLTYSNIAATSVPEGTASTITVSAQNTLAIAGNATVWLSIDGQNVSSQVVSFAAGQTKTVTFTLLLKEGTHTVAVGSSSTSVAIGPPPLPVWLIALAVGLLVVGLVVGVVVGRMRGRKRKGPPTSMPEESGGGMGGTAEEELSPEDKL